MKLLRDTVKNPQTGKFSRKSVTALSFFAFAVILAGVDTFTELDVNTHYFDGFMTVAQLTLGLTVADKIVHKTQHHGKPPNAG